jgi:hypothetical protein
VRAGRGSSIGSTLLAATLLAVGLVLGPVGTAPALAADDGLAVVTKATYTLAPKDGVVHVVVTVKATNTKPNLVEQTSIGPLTTRYFFEKARLVVQSEATKIRASAGWVRLAVTPHEAGNYKVVDVAFRSDLFYKQSTAFRLDFDLPGGAPRSEGDIRVGSAFATFYVWAFGDRGDVAVNVPAGFTVTSTGSPLKTAVVRGTTILTAAGVTDITNWYVVVVADRHEALTQERLDLAGGEHLIVRAWPEDKEWQKRVGDLLRTGLPTLVDLVGLDWPVTGDIEVAEVHTPLLEGYAGIFHVGEDRIEISEDLDELTIIHEASHAWFNSGLFIGRWIDEGFADEYASLVLDQVSSDTFKPDPVQPAGPGNVRLNEWVHPGRIADEATNLTEQYGYDASWTVVRALVDEIGVARMRDVIAAAADERIPYAGAGTPERLTGAADWRRFLDLLEQVGGSNKATDLFDTWVVLDKEKPLLAQRTDARTAYAALVEAGAGWQPGIAVRRPLADWDFAAARTRIEATLAILETRDQIATLASEVGATPPATLRSAYEAATDLAPVKALADAQLAAAEALATTKTRIDGTRDLPTAVGLIGSDPSAELAAAVTAFGTGDTAGVTTAASHADALLAAAPDVGRTRLLTGGGLLVGGALLGGASVAFYRRRRPVHLGPPVPAVESDVAVPTVVADQSSVSDGGPAETALTPAPKPTLLRPREPWVVTPPPAPKFPRPQVDSSSVARSSPDGGAGTAGSTPTTPAPITRLRRPQSPWVATPPPEPRFHGPESLTEVPPVAPPEPAAERESVAKPNAATESQSGVKPKSASVKPKSASVKPKSASAKPTSGAKPKSVAKSKSAAKPNANAKPKSVAKPNANAKPKSVAKPKSAPSQPKKAVPDTGDPYATLGAPPADAAGQEPAAPGGEEEP